MMPFKRGPVPLCLQGGFKKWGKRFAQRRKANSSAAFKWPTWQGQDVGKLLRELLIAGSQNHCCYCDGYPLGETGRRTIDHFRPKSRFPRLACVWANLFLCCDVCQVAKGESFERGLLKPDRPDFQFHRYFIYKYRTGEVLPNPSANPSDQDAARVTIKTFDLNSKVRQHSRRYHASCEPDPTDPNAMPYRFLFPQI